MKRAALSLAIIAASVVTTLTSLTPVSRGLSKVDGWAMRVATEAFWREAMPSLAIGLALIALGAWLIEARFLLGLLFLIIAPAAALATGLLL